MTDGLRRHSLRTIMTAGTLALLLVLTGCMFDTQGSEAMVEESERVLAVAEDVMPQIATSLDLTIDSAESTPYTGQGVEGVPKSFIFELRGALDGPLPSQSALQEAIAAAGLIESVIPEDDGQLRAGRDEAPKVIAFTEDESTQVSITYWATHDELRFSVTNTDQFHISDQAYDEYFPALIPEFDPSLVKPVANQ